MALEDSRNVRGGHLHAAGNFGGELLALGLVEYARQRIKRDLDKAGE